MNVHKYMFQVCCVHVFGFVYFALDCDGNLVDWDTPSYQFTRSFPNNVGRDLLCEMGVDNGGWIVCIYFAFRCDKIYISKLFYRHFLITSLKFPLQGVHVV